MDKSFPVIQNAASGFLWGDYEGLTATADTFYGVFTGQSIGRTTLQLDPIFFRESALPADSGCCPCPKRCFSSRRQRCGPVLGGWRRRLWR